MSKLEIVHGIAYAISLAGLVVGAGLVLGPIAVWFANVADNYRRSR